MKTRALLLLCAILALAACNNDDNDTLQTPPTQPEPTEPVTPITFNLTATRPGDVATTRGGDSGGWRWQSWDDDEPAGKTMTATTRAVKQTWEAGDAIFVFFHKTNEYDDYIGVRVPVHLKMTYDGEKWTSVEYDGPTASPGALSTELYYHPTGTMTAVYLPYGSNATVSAAGEEDQYGRYHTFAFSETHYAYYMMATLPYTVTDNTVSGAFDMRIPDGYVQFFVKDDKADKNVDCLLGMDAVISVDVASVGDDGTITETTAKKASDDLPGFVYDDGTVKGYVFYGKLNPDYDEVNKVYGEHHVYVVDDYHKGHYFAKIKPNYIYENNNSGDEYEHPSDYGTPVIRDERYDYFVRDKTLASHDAIKLPDADNIIHFNSDGSFGGGKWIEVGENISVKLQNIDVNGTITELGTWYTCNINSSRPDRNSGGTWYEVWQLPGLPSQEQFELLKYGCQWTWVSMHGRPGCIVQCNTGFLFLPSDDVGYEGYFWTSTRSELELAEDGPESMMFWFVHVGGEDTPYNKGFNSVPRNLAIPVRLMAQ